MITINFINDISFKIVCLVIARASSLTTTCLQKMIDIKIKWDGLGDIIFL